MYKFSDVKSFSLGDRSYVNLGKEKFVIKCGDGKINLFARVYASPGAKSSLLLMKSQVYATKQVIFTSLIKMVTNQTQQQIISLR
jgi:hypothetical protein